jgi:glycosyltransferase involved in cell wall biosynthesis
VKIAVYTITKNEEQFIERWAESCVDADYRLIVDTGSTDNTIYKALANECEVATILVNPWRFDDARNASLALLPPDIDMCISLDADEVLRPGWREHLELLPSHITRPRYKYVWSWNADGSEGLVYHGDKIHSRNGYRWRHPVHEVLTPVLPEAQMVCGLEIHHHPDNSKSRAQYLPLLELAVREDPNNDRNLFYLGREYMYKGMTDQAINTLTRHLELSTWDAERSASMRYLGRLTGNTESWFLKACAEAPHRREPWVELACHYYNTHKWTYCLSAAKRALDITEKPLEYICEADAWGFLPYDLACIAAWHVGQYTASLEYGNKALEFSPGNERIINNIKLVKTSLGLEIPSVLDTDNS